MNDSGTFGELSCFNWRETAVSIGVSSCPKWRSPLFRLAWKRCLDWRMPCSKWRMHALGGTIAVVRLPNCGHRASVTSICLNKTTLLVHIRTGNEKRTPIGTDFGSERSGRFENTVGHRFQRVPIAILQPCRIAIWLSFQLAC